MRRPDFLQGKNENHKTLLVNGICSNRCNRCMKQMNLLFVEQLMLLGSSDAEGAGHCSPRICYSPVYILLDKSCPHCETGDGFVMSICNKMNVLNLCALSSASVASLQGVFLV